MLWYHFALVIMFQVTHLPHSYQFSSCSDVVCVAALFCDEIVDGDDKLLDQYKPSFNEGVSRRRRADFLAGRLCAAKALYQLGSSELLVPLASVPATPPLWPTDFVGSITHTEQFAAAAIARQGTIKYLGVDAERIIGDEECEEVASVISSADELEQSAACYFRPGELVSLLFSAKESVYKCFFSRLKSDLSFREIDISLERNSSRFQFSFPEGPGDLPKHGEGAFSLDGTRVYSSVAQRHDGGFL